MSRTELLKAIERDPLTSAADRAWFREVLAPKKRVHVGPLRAALGSAK